MQYNYFSDKSVLELREMFSNVDFLEAKFDRSVMGIDLATNRVIYHEWDMINILMEELDEDCQDLDPDSDQWCDLYDQCMESVYMIESENECIQTGVSNLIICRDSNQLCNYSFIRPRVN